MTKNQKEFKRIVANARRLIKRAEKRGFRFPSGIVDISRPERITRQRLEKLKRELSPQNLYEKAFYLDTESGKIVTGTEGRKLERSKSAKKGRQKKEIILTGDIIDVDKTPIGPSEDPFDITTEVLDYLNALFEEYENEPYTAHLKSWYEGMIKTVGLKKFVEILQKVNWITDEAFMNAVFNYEDAQISFTTRHIDEFVKEGAMTQEMADIIKQMMLDSLGMVDVYGE
ncbi:MAG: DNA polymerase [Podoviridae sp. ctjc_2]|nr:MAG: DNA polymerase [Podoviridae sp. ctjc_2]